MFPLAMHLFIITLSYRLFTEKPLLRRDIIHWWFCMSLKQKKEKLNIESFPSTNVHVENNTDLKKRLTLDILIRIDEG